MPERDVTLGEHIANIWNIIFRWIIMLVIPLIALYTAFLFKPGDNFFAKLLYQLLLVYLLGGFFVFGLKIWETWDWKYVLFKRGFWKSDPVMKKTFYKIAVPAEATYSVMNMYSVFNRMRTILNGARTKYDKYILGKWYYDIAFDLILRNGKPELYICFPMKFFEVMNKAFEVNYPGTKLIQTEDPYAKWPRRWIPGVSRLGPYNDFFATDYGLASTDLFPLGHPSSFDEGKTPIGDLIKSLLSLDPNLTLILQWTFRPFPADGKMESWEKELASFRKDAMSKGATIDIESNGTRSQAVSGELITDVTKRIINGVESKFGENHFKTHMRMVVLCPKEKMYEVNNVNKLMKPYLGSIASDIQILELKRETCTGITFKTTGSEAWDPIIGPLLDKHYFPQIQKYRKRTQYWGLLDRGLENSWPSNKFFFDAASCSSMFHLPSGVGIFTEYLETESLQENPAQTEVEMEGSSFAKLQQLREKNSSISAAPNSDSRLAGLRGRV